jgi:hypothetical protein
VRSVLFLSIGLMLCSGCVQRKLTVTSDPPGAVVTLNDQDVGRTPFTRDFIWYGTYDVAVREEGYQTLKTHSRVIAPWWQWFPIDLLTEFLPVTDRHALHYTLKPAATQPADQKAVVTRAKQMQGQLQGSER